MGNWKWEAPAPRVALSLAGRATRTGCFKGSERAQPHICARQDRVRPTQMIHATGLLTVSWDEYWPLCTRTGAGTWGLESRLGEGTTADHEETAWVDGREELYNWEWSRRKLRLPEKWSTIVTWYVNGRAVIANSFLTCKLLFPTALGRTLARASSSTPAIASSAPLPTCTTH